MVNDQKVILHFGENSVEGPVVAVCHAEAGREGQHCAQSSVRGPRA